MNDDLARGFHVPLANEPIDPVTMARRDLKKALPRRFYRDVTVAEASSGFGVLLDGRQVRTPAKAMLILPTRLLAQALADEWTAQADVVEPDSMPLTRLANSAIDGVAARLAATVEEVAKFAETDLVCYRAGDPDLLVAAQVAAWDPVLAFARERLHARFVCAEGILYVEQPEPARRAVRAAVEAIGGGPSAALRLAALSVMTTLTGSILIGLAVAAGAMTAETAWAAANVDQDFQMRFWGADEQALAIRARRWRDMDAAATLYALSEAG